MSYEHGVNNPFTAEEIETCLHALVAWAGNASQTSRYLKAEKDLDISHVTLNNWKRVHGPRYDEIREKYTAQIETRLAFEMRETAALAVAATKLGVEKAAEKLEAGKEDDPSRAAANLSRIAQSNVDKLLSLTGRPSRITEDRNIGEILRSLAAKGVISIPDAPVDAPVLEESTGISEASE